MGAKSHSPERQLHSLHLDHGRLPYSGQPVGLNTHTYKIAIIIVGIHVYPCHSHTVLFTASSSPSCSETYLPVNVL